jgi:hypothetical protein
MSNAKSHTTTIHAIPPVRQNPIDEYLEKARAALKKETQVRIYLETLERLFNGTEKIIIDPGAASGAVPYLPSRNWRRRARPKPVSRSWPMKLNLAGGVTAALVLLALGQR